MDEQTRKQLELAESYICKAGEILHALYVTTPTVPQPQAKPAATKGITKINSTEVPATIQELADIREGDSLYILTKPWTPDKGDWMEINNFVKVCGGKWVSAGKDSRWEIPKK